MAIAARTNRRHVSHRPPLVRQRSTESSVALSLIVVVLMTLGITAVLLSSQMLDVSVPRGFLPSFGVKTASRPADGAVPATQMSLTATGEQATDTLVSLDEQPGDIARLAIGARARVANTDNLGVVFYTAPRDNARRPAGLLEGTAVTVLELSGSEWARVQSDSKKSGWVRADYLVPSE